MAGLGSGMISSHPTDNNTNKNIYLFISASRVLNFLFSPGNRLLKYNPGENDLLEFDSFFLMDLE